MAKGITGFWTPSRGLYCAARFLLSPCCVKHSPFRNSRASSGSARHRSSSHFTKAEDELILSRRQEGNSWRGIAAELLGKHSAYLVAKRHSAILHGSEATSPVSFGGQYSNYTPAEDELILQRRREGRTLRQIAAELGRRSGHSLASRSSRLPRTAHSPARQQRSFTAAEDPCILKCVRAGKTFASIGAELGRSRTTIANRFHMTTSAPKRQVRRWTATEDEYVVSLRAAGKPWKEIAARLDRSPAGAKHHYNRYVRPKPSAPETAIRQRQNHFWTDAEVAMLKKLKEDERLPWEQVAARMGNPTSNLQDRYYRLLREEGHPPKALRKWEPNEDRKILHSRKVLGLTWNQTVSQLPGRTYRSVVYRYQEHLASHDGSEI